MIPRIALVFPLFALFFASPAAAQDVVAGFEGGPSSGMGFVSPIFSFPLDTEQAIFVKPAVSYLYYDTRTFLGQTRITAPAVSLGAGYRYSDGRFAFDLGPALEVLWERRKNLFGPDTKETLVGVMIAGDALYQAAPLTNVNLSASYDQANQYFWSRAGVKQRVTDLQSQSRLALSIGAEVTGQGDKDVQQLGGGGLIEFALDQGATAFQIRGGYSWLTYADHTTASRPYFGAGLYHRF